MVWGGWHRALPTKIKGQARGKQEPNDQEIETAQGPGKPKQGTGATREPSKSATGAAQGPSNANQNKARAQQQGPNEQQGEAKRIGRHISSYGSKPRKALGHKNLAPQAVQNRLSPFVRGRAHTKAGEHT